MEVDWAGAALDIHNSVTGEVSKAYLFVAVLPCSCFTYAEVCDDMKLENWISCHIHTYNYFGGVTRLLVPDNLKTGVTKNTRYETVLNRTYQELAEYYGTAIVPARVHHPQDKSHAEGGVNFASTWILAALRSRKFFSVEEAVSYTHLTLFSTVGSAQRPCSMVRGGLTRGMPRLPSMEAVRALPSPQTKAPAPMFTWIRKEKSVPMT